MKIYLDSWTENCLFVYSMRLVNRNQSVPGGFFYRIPETGEKVMTSGNLDKLQKSVVGYYHLKKLDIPDDLGFLIEDQICERVPEQYCRYGRGMGDRIAQAIHSVAGVVDTVLGTNLKQRARGCGGCSKRRRKLNGATF